MKSSLQLTSSLWRVSLASNLKKIFVSTLQHSVFPLFFSMFSRSPWKPQRSKKRVIDNHVKVVEHFSWACSDRSLGACTFYRAQVAPDPSQVFGRPPSRAEESLTAPCYVWIIFIGTQFIHLHTDKLCSSYTENFELRCQFFCSLAGWVSGRTQSRIVCALSFDSKKASFFMKNRLAQIIAHPPEASMSRAALEILVPKL